MLYEYLYLNDTIYNIKYICMWDSVPVEIGLVADPENGLQFRALNMSVLLSGA